MKLRRNRVLLRTTGKLVSMQGAPELEPLFFTGKGRSVTRERYNRSAGGLACLARLEGQSHRVAGGAGLLSDWDVNKSIWDMFWSM